MIKAAFIAPLIFLMLVPIKASATPVGFAWRLGVFSLDEKDVLPGGRISLMFSRFFSLDVGNYLLSTNFGASLYPVDMEWKPYVSYKQGSFSFFADTEFYKMVLGGLFYKNFYIEAGPSWVHSHELNTNRKDFAYSIGYSWMSSAMFFGE